MPQLNYSYDMPKGLLGAIAQSSPKMILTYTASEKIPFGSGVVYRKGSDNEVRLPSTNEVTINFDADLITGNRFTLLVDGTPVPTVVYATSHVATMNAIADAITNASDDVEGVFVGGATNRELRIAAKPNRDIAITHISLTEGASQANHSIIQDSSDDFVGVALLQQIYEMDQNGESAYPPQDPCGVMTKGFCWVYIEEDVAPLDPVFLRHLTVDGDRKIGQFRKSDDDNTCIDINNCRWARKCSGPGLGMLELNLP